MRKPNISRINYIYIMFLIFILIIMLLASFKSGIKMYYLVNTNLNSKEIPGSSYIAHWKFEVRIEY